MVVFPQIAGQLKSWDRGFGVRIKAFSKFEGRAHDIFSIAWTEDRAPEGSDSSVDPGPPNGAGWIRPALVRRAPGVAQGDKSRGSGGRAPDAQRAANSLGV